MDDALDRGLGCRLALCDKRHWLGAEHRPLRPVGILCHEPRLPRRTNLTWARWDGHALAACAAPAGASGLGLADWLAATSLRLKGFAPQPVQRAEVRKWHSYEVREQSSTSSEE